MPLTRTTHHPATTAPRRRGGLFSRRRPRHSVVTTTTTTRRRKGLFARRAAPAHRAAPVHHRRKPTLKDKVSGALLKLKGTLTHRPAVKAAGTRRMHGTDGRGSRRRQRNHVL